MGIAPAAANGCNNQRLSMNAVEPGEHHDLHKTRNQVLGDAASIVQGIGKPFHAFVDFVLSAPRWWNFIPAYDLDE